MNSKFIGLIAGLWILVIASVGLYCPDIVKTFFHDWRDALGPLAAITGVLVALGSIWHTRWLAKKNHSDAIERDKLKEKREHGLKLVEDIHQIISELPECPTNADGGKIDSTIKKLNNLKSKVNVLSTRQGLYFDNLELNLKETSRAFFALCDLIEPGKLPNSDQYEQSKLRFTRSGFEFVRRIQFELSAQSAPSGTFPQISDSL